MITLNNCLKEYNGIQFIFAEEADALIKKYNRANRKQNDNIEYMLDEDKRNLFKITRDKKDWCGDFIVKVATREEFNEFRNKNTQSNRITELEILTKNLTDFCSTYDMRLGQIIDVLIKNNPEIDLFNIENKNLNLLLEKFKNSSIVQG